jgi:hypothetical protein
VEMSGTDYVANLDYIEITSGNSTYTQSNYYSQGSYIIATPTPYSQANYYSQSSYISSTATDITGVVSSSTGGVISGVKVSMTVSGAKKVTTTNSQGQYSLLNIPPGTYSITFQNPAYRNTSESVTVNSVSVIKNVTMVKK